MHAYGVDEAQIHSVTDNLIWCDLVGRRNHGVERLPILMQRVRKGVINCPCELKFEQLTEPMARLDGDNGFGHHVSAAAIDRAVELAREHGVGIVGVRGSNFFGAGAYYVNRAAERGMISLALSNSFPKVAAIGGFKTALGTNPFAFGAPRRDGRALMVDMSTAALAGSTIRELIKSGGDLPAGSAIDADGQTIIDPAKVSQGTLLPAAGPKGFGLAIMVEMLSSVLTGAGMSHQLGSMYNNLEEGGHNGQFFMAIDVKRWMSEDEYYGRFETLAAMILASGPDGKVRLPGDSRWACYNDNIVNGIVLEPATRKAIEILARECELAVPWQI